MEKNQVKRPGWPGSLWKRATCTHVGVPFTVFTVQNPYTAYALSPDAINFVHPVTP